MFGEGAFNTSYLSPKGVSLVSEGTAPIRSLTWPTAPLNRVPIIPQGQGQLPAGRPVQGQHPARSHHMQTEGMVVGEEGRFH